jgi:predicted alpha/beta hydrolase family esterase
MPPTKIIFIHGNGTMHWAIAWAPWLKLELDKLGFETIFETFPDSILARKQYWMPFLKDFLQADENALLIGWSSGAVAALKYAQENKIFGSVLIAPAHTDLGKEEEKISEWFDEPFDWAKIRQNQKKIAMIFSENDEYIPLHEFIFIQEKLAPDKELAFKDKGHFLHQATFPEILNFVKEEANQTQ